MNVMIAANELCYGSPGTIVMNAEGSVLREKVWKDITETLKSIDPDLHIEY